MPDAQTPIERVFSGSARHANLNIWGKLFIDKTGHGNNGWLIDSWSEGGAPYWRPHMNWLATKDNKLYLVQMNIGMHNSDMNIYHEDTDIEPGRAEFIRANIEKWEQQWLDEEAKNL